MFTKLISILNGLTLNSDEYICSKAENVLKLINENK
jgi:hypothetical protein